MCPMRLFHMVPGFCRFTSNLRDVGRSRGWIRLQGIRAAFAEATMTAIEMTNLPAVLEEKDRGAVVGGHEHGSSVCDNRAPYSGLGDETRITAQPTPGTCVNERIETQSRSEAPPLRAFDTSESFREMHHAVLDDGETGRLVLWNQPTEDLFAIPIASSRSGVT